MTKMNSSFFLIAACAVMLYTMTAACPGPRGGKDRVPLPGKKGPRTKLLYPHSPDGSMRMIPPGKLDKHCPKVMIRLRKCICFALFKKMLPLKPPKDAHRMCLKTFKRKSAIMKLKNPCMKFTNKGKIDKKMMAKIKRLRKKCMSGNFKPGGDNKMEKKRQTPSM